MVQVTLSAAYVAANDHEYFLHKQRSEVLPALHLVKSNRQISIVDVPWHLQA